MPLQNEFSKDKTYELHYQLVIEICFDPYVCR